MNSNVYSGAALATVVTPCYNQAHFLGEAIESVLGQSYPNFESIVVDSGSTDHTSGALAQGELIEIGAHPETHPALATLPVVSRRDEILESKARLEEILGHRATGFLYPHGSPSTETVAVVREAGFARACSDLAAVIEGSPCPFQLPSMSIEDWGGRGFARRLSGWLDR